MTPSNDPASAEQTLPQGKASPTAEDTANDHLGTMLAPGTGVVDDALATMAAPVGYRPAVPSDDALATMAAPEGYQPAAPSDDALATMAAPAGYSPGRLPLAGPNEIVGVLRNPVAASYSSSQETAAQPVSPLDASGTMAAPQDYTPAGAGNTRTLGTLSTIVAPPGAIGLAGRYAVMRPLAKGGMGQVAVARDTELDRDIALKEIQPKFKLDGATLHRFMLEARVTGRLEHPGVVPVYGLGTYPDGRPYYAMRFITGRAFSEAITEFHDADKPGRDPRERSLAMRAMLRRYVDVCNTIGYAHSKGILHRDIKPANVMLGEYGETLVVDWGLAKDLNDGAAKPSPPDEHDLGITQYEIGLDPASEETREGYTHYGQTMGTPAYMSPEQAAGKWDITGVASDVYSLGAMLYVLLSGTPPYSGPSYEVITKVQRGEHKTVKLVKGDTPDPLDAIVHKAMAFDIKDRYPNALELAADVERWLGDEPVSCFREPFLVRASRWARRHRTAVAAAAALLLTGAIALSLGLFFVNRERKAKEQAYVAASESRDETIEALKEKQKSFLLAQESRGDARDALLALTDDAMGEILAGSEKTSPQQKKYLKSLIAMYQKFTAKEAESPESKLFIAGAWYRVGRLQARVEEYPEARTSYTEALKVLADPSVAAVPGARYARGEVELYSGVLELQQGKREAEAWLTKATETFRNLVLAEPKVEHRARYSQALDRFGTFFMQLRAWPKAEPYFKESLALREKLHAEFPDDAEYQFRHAQSLRQLAGVNLALGRVKEGRDYAAKARKLQEEIVAKNETSATYLSLLADIDTLLASHYTPLRPLPPTGEKPAADSLAVFHARQAVRGWGRIVALNPGDTKFRQRFAEANISLARQCIDNNQPREAVMALEAAIATLTELERDDTKNLPVTKLKLLQARVGEQMAFRKLGDPRAKSVGEAAVKSAEELVKMMPANAEARQYAATAYIERALLRIAANDANAAKADLDAGWPHVQAAANGGEAAVVQSYQRTLANWMALADDFGGAVAAGKAITELKLPKGEAWYDAACFHARVAHLLVTSGKPLSDDWQKFADKQLSESIYCLQQAAKAGFDQVDLMDSEPDLGQIRQTNEYGDVRDAMMPKRVEN